MDIGILPVHDIPDDGMERCLAEIMAIDSAADVTEGIERSRVCDCDTLAVFQAKPRPRGFRQRRFIMRNEIARRLIERGDHLPLAVAEQNARVCAKSFRPTNVTLLVHEDDGLVLGVETEPARTNDVRGRRRAGGGQTGMLFIHMSSTFSPWSGTKHRQPSSSSMRWRSASDAAGSPWVTNVMRGAALKPPSQRKISSTS